MSLKRVSKEHAAYILSLTKEEVKTVSGIVKLITKYNTAYHNTSTPLVSDEAYDEILDILESYDPAHPLLKKVGAPPVEQTKKTVVKVKAVKAVDVKETKAKVKLPFYMGSLTKIKTESALTNFMKKHAGDSWVISDKLDGVSALFDISKNKLYTRGDGTIGQDISILLPYLRGIPKKISGDYMVRGEIIISVENFKSLDKGANPRNIISGLVNAGKITEQYKNLAEKTDFIAYSLYKPDDKTVQDQFNIMKNVLGLNTAWNTTVKTLSFDSLSNTLARRREESIYDIDGIVVSHNGVYKNVADKNPEHSMAFKYLLSQQVAEVEVTDVEWNVSKDGLLKPTVIFDAVALGGVQVRRATGHNGFYIKENGIGPGAKILVTRSGDVIPYIQSVSVPSKKGPKMPDVKFIWVGNKDIQIVDMEQNSDKSLKELTHFFECLDIKGLGPGTVKKMFDAGYTDVKSVVNMNEKNFTGIQGFANKAALYQTIKESMGDDMNCLKLMVASNCFGQGFGDRKLKLLMNTLDGDLNNMSYVPSVDQLVAIEGIQTLTANKFLEGLMKYRAFLKSTGLHCKGKVIKEAEKKVIKEAEKKVIKEAEKKVTKSLENEVIVFSGFRDKDLAALIEERGGKTDANKKNPITILVLKDIDSESAKTKKAQEAGAKIMTKDDFLRRYIVY
jgi:DNA ligase (NAD+)